MKFKFLLFFILSVILTTNNAYANLNNINDYIDESLIAWQQYWDGQKFKDPFNTNRSDGYGRSMFAYSFIKRGVETGNEQWINLGLSALNSQVSSNSKVPFDLLVISKIYNYNQTHLLENPNWVAIRNNTENYLINFTKYEDNPLKCYANDNCYDNWKLVEALALSYLKKTNLQSINVNSYLYQDNLDKRFNFLINLIYKNKKDFNINQTHITKLSDPPNNPLAYHAFSNYLINNLSNNIDNNTINIISKATNEYANNFINPYGEIAYMGRSYKQNFNLSSLIYANLNQYNKNNNHYLLYLADNQFKTLNIYPKNNNLINITASTRFNHYKGIDNYATMAVYNALIIMQLLDSVDLIQNNIDESNFININNYYNTNNQAQLFCDDNICIFKNNNIGNRHYLSLALKNSLNDNRYQAGILEIFVNKKQLSDNRLKNNVSNFILNNKPLTKISATKRNKNQLITIFEFGNQKRKTIFTFENNVINIKMNLKNKDKLAYNIYADNIIKANKKEFINNNDSLFKFKEIRKNSIRKITFNRFANKIIKTKNYNNAVSNKVNSYQYIFNKDFNITIR